MLLWIIPLGIWMIKDTSKGITQSLDYAILYTVIWAQIKLMGGVATGLYTVSHGQVA